MSDTPKLLPCPFCGEPFPRIENERLGPGIWFKCRKCFCQTSGHAVTTEAAISEWNHRAAPAWSSELPTETGAYWLYISESGAGPLMVEVYCGLFEGLFVASPSPFRIGRGKSKWFRTYRREIVVGKSTNET